MFHTLARTLPSITKAGSVFCPIGQPMILPTSGNTIHACMVRRASCDGTDTSRRGGLASADSACAGEVPLLLVPQANKAIVRACHWPAPS